MSQLKETNKYVTSCVMNRNKMKQEKTDKDECDRFPGQQTKGNTITEALKIYSVFSGNFSSAVPSP